MHLEIWLFFSCHVVSLKVDWLGHWTTGQVHRHRHRRAKPGVMWLCICGRCDHEKAGKIAKFFLSLMYKPDPESNLKLLRVELLYT